MKGKKWIIPSVISFVIVAVIFLWKGTDSDLGVVKTILVIIPAFAVITLIIRMIIDAASAAVQKQKTEMSVLEAQNKAIDALPKSRAQDQSESSIKCPKCGSTSISADKKGFGVGKAVVGSAIAGPIGLAAGNLGAKKVRVTCLKCGHQWMAGKAK